MKMYYSPKQNAVEIKNHTSLLCASAPINKTTSTPPIPENDNFTTYWDKYKKDYPQKASEIVSLGLDFSKLPDKEVKEKVFAIETTAKDSQCEISQIRDLLFAQWDGKFEEGEYIYLIDFLDEKTFDESEKYNIERTNTIWYIAEGWVLDKVHDIEKKYTSLSPRIKKDSISALMQFELEDSDKFSILRKIHIYLNNYPMTSKNQKYTEVIQDLFAKYMDEYIKPLADNEENKKSPSLFNFAIQCQAHMASVKIKEECKNLIQECNQHDVSFYTELDIAVDEALKKYSM